MNIGHWSPQGWWGRGKLIGDFCFFFFFFFGPGTGHISEGKGC